MHQKIRMNMPIDMLCNKENVTPTGFDYLLYPYSTKYRPGGTLKLQIQAGNGILLKQNPGGMAFCGNM